MWISFLDNVDLVLYSFNEPASEYYFYINDGASRINVCFNSDKLHPHASDYLSLREASPIGRVEIKDVINDKIIIDYSI